MSFQTRMTEDLIKIAGAGGGFHLNASTRMTNDLVRIAAAASTSGAKLVFSGMSTRMTDDLARIASAGKGNVVFGD